MIPCADNGAGLPIRKGPHLWDYKGVWLIADVFPKIEQLRLVDYLPDEARGRISHIHHFDDENGACKSLELVWIEPEPSIAEKWLWLVGWDGGAPISFGVVPAFLS